MGRLPSAMLNLKEANIDAGQCKQRDGHSGASHDYCRL